MSYATLSDVVTRYKPIQTLIGSQDNDVSSVDVCSVFIAQAEGYVDAFIGAKYILPLAAPIPMIITQVTADLALFYMMAEKLPSVPEFMDKRYNRCGDILARLRDGKMVLPSSIQVSSTGDQQAWSSTMGYHSIFDPSMSITEQVPDSSRTCVEDGKRDADLPNFDER